MVFFRRKYFKRIFISSVIVLGLFLMVLFGFFVQRQRKEIHQKMLYECKVKAERIVQIVDEKFQTIDMLANQIAVSNWIDYMASGSEIINKMMDDKMKKMVYSQIDNGNILLQVGDFCSVIFPKIGRVVHKSNIWDIDRYLYVNDMEENLMEIINERQPYASGALTLFAFQEEDIEGDFFAVKKIRSKAKNEAAFLMKINANMFKKYINLDANEIDVFSISQNGELIYSVSQVKKLENECIEMQIASRLYDWEYNIAINAENMANDKDDFSLSGIIPMVILFLGGILLVILCAYLLSRIIYKPIIMMIEKLDIKDETDDCELERIECLFDELFQQKSKMEQLANLYYQVAMDEFLHSLIKGKYLEAHVEENARLFNSGFTQKMEYMVIYILCLDDSKYKEYYDAILKMQVDGRYNEVPTMAYEEKKFTGLILILGTEKGSSILKAQGEWIMSLSDLLFDEIDIKILCGEVYKGFEGISKSYQDIMKKKEMNITYRAEYYYPYEIEEEFVRQIQYGNYENAKQILLTLEYGNKNRQVSPDVEKRLLFVLRETILRHGTMMIEIDSIMQISMDNEKFDDIAEIWESLRNVLEDMRIVSNNVNDVQKLGDKIVKYVHEHYTSGGLSQMDIADQFNISRSTVSKVFKETTHLTFVEYLQKLRVKYAKQLIRQGKRDVLQIGRECGFETEITFNRAFVKNEGISVREYIKKWNQ